MLQDLGELAHRLPPRVDMQKQTLQEQNKALVIQPVIIIPSCISGSLILKLLKALLATLLSTMRLPETLKQKWPYQVRPKVHLTQS